MNVIPCLARERSQARVPGLLSATGGPAWGWVRGAVRAARDRGGERAARTRPPRLEGKDPELPPCLRNTVRSRDNSVRSSTDKELGPWCPQPSETSGSGAGESGQTCTNVGSKQYPSG